MNRRALVVRGPIKPQDSLCIQIKLSPLPSGNTYTPRVIAAIVLALVFLAPGVLLLRAGWTWTGWIAVVFGLWLSGGAFAAWFRNRRRRRAESD